MFQAATTDISTFVAKVLTGSKYHAWSEGEYLLFPVSTLRCCCIFQNRKKKTLKTVDGIIGQITSSWNNFQFPFPKPYVWFLHSFAGLNSRSASFPCLPKEMLIFYLQLEKYSFEKPMSTVRNAPNPRVKDALRLLSVSCSCSETRAKTALTFRTS